ncbi:MAG TPA: ABC transporter permease [Chloroflexota bacterium]|nr:ABC transporter permease [Chloroflexota bacterium]
MEQTLADTAVQTAAAAPALGQADALAELPERTLWQDAWRRFRKHRMARTGLVVYLLLVTLVLVGPFVWRVNVLDIDFMASNAGPSPVHPLGADDLGRDTLARVLNGGRVSVAVGIAAMVVSITLGSLVGSLSGYFGTWVDIVLMRITEVFLSIPQLPVLLLITYLFRQVFVNALGPNLGVFVMIVSVLGGLNWMSTARLVRAGFLTLREREFVEACRVLGVGHGRIIFRHILPNTLSPIIVAATLAVGSSMIAEATLSFLGLGFPPDFPTWGRLLNDALNYLTINPMMALVPGTMIFLAVLSINFIGDGLRDALDPRRGA